MKHLFLILTVLIAMSTICSAESSSASEEKGLFAGGYWRLSLIDGTGKLTINNITFNFNATSTRYSSDENSGLSWVNRRLWGLSPSIGYRFSSRFALLAAYNFSFQKKSDESYKYKSEDYLVNVNSDYQWNQESLEFLALISPFSLTRFHALVGVEFVSVKVDMNTKLQIVGSDVSTTERESGRAKCSSMILGAEYEWPVSKRSNLHFSSTYSFAELKDTFFSTKEEWKIGVGGLRMQIGFRYFPFKAKE
jgi:hypothetical protein